MCYSPQTIHKCCGLQSAVQCYSSQSTVLVTLYRSSSVGSTVYSLQSTLQRFRSQSTACSTTNRDSFVALCCSLHSAVRCFGSRSTVLFVTLYRSSGEAVYSLLSPATSPPTSGSLYHPCAAVCSLRCGALVRGLQCFSSLSTDHLVIQSAVCGLRPRVPQHVDRCVALCCGLQCSASVRGLRCSSSLSADRLVLWSALCGLRPRVPLHLDHRHHPVLRSAVCSAALQLTGCSTSFSTSPSIK